MFCPQCAEPNPDQAKFCRACGGELSLLPQVLSGRVPEHTQQLVRRGIANVHVSTAVLLIAIVVGLLVPAPISWAVCVVMAVIAVGFVTNGVARLKQVRDGAYRQEASVIAGLPPRSAIAAEQGRASVEVGESASVTEGTTECLDTRRHETR